MLCFYFVLLCPPPTHTPPSSLPSPTRRLLTALLAAPGLSLPPRCHLNSRAMPRQRGDQTRPYARPCAKCERPPQGLSAASRPLGCFFFFSRPTPPRVCRVLLLLELSEAREALVAKCRRAKRGLKKQSFTSEEPRRRSKVSAGVDTVDSLPHSRGGSLIISLL